MRNKSQYNDKGQQHGLWEYYYYNGNLLFKGTYLKGEYIGLWIRGFSDGLIKQISFYAK